MNPQKVIRRIMYKAHMYRHGIKKWVVIPKWMMRDVPLYAILSLILLTSCTKEYSYEKTCIEYTTINWEDGETMKSWRQVDRPLRNDTSYSIGSARPAVVIVKTECK